MNDNIFDLYVDYLPSSVGSVTATGLSDLVNRLRKAPHPPPSLSKNLKILHILNIPIRRLYDYPKNP